MCKSRQKPYQWLMRTIILLELAKNVWPANDVKELLERGQPSEDIENRYTTLAQTRAATSEGPIYLNPKYRSESPASFRGSDGHRMPVIPHAGLTEPTPIRAHPELPQVRPTETDPRHLESGTTLGGSHAAPNSSNPSDPSSIWQTVVERATSHDNQLVKDWQKSMNVLLIFAALFAGILTAFLIESTKRLEGNYSEKTVVLLRQIAQNLNNTLPTYVPPEPRRSTSTLLLINRLWFSSLSLTLGSAVGAMVVKQWLYEYRKDLKFQFRDHTSRGRYQRGARLREFRYNGLLRWYVPEIIGFFPIALHAALLLFWVGLVHYLWELDLYTSILVLVTAGTALVAYIISMILPSIFTGCPYKTPISHLISNTNRAIWIILNRWPKPEPTDLSEEKKIKARFRDAIRVHRVLWEDEKEVVERHAPDLAKKCLERLRASTMSEAIVALVTEELQRLSHTTPHHPISIPQHATYNITSGITAVNGDLGTFFSVEGQGRVPLLFDLQLPNSQCSSDTSYSHSELPRLGFGINIAAHTSTGTGLLSPY
ncbi:uncharacterized protein EI90DRAFT_3015147 [Cantharellus anzutake]|uniref:uncharacterized protein n=1 Tax=Cantharellus anzutake TaxID=1750568 RepID=UPI001908F5F1|nr:uncharacterized protein EI90DRAFT_3015147 [Cantharellus anzutake]KAF8334107.1 hypothetical protein EI90DRAFT_3015147 [Cantharellus anzutake]